MAARGGWCLAVDIGGTKLAAGAVDSAGFLTARTVTPTPVTNDPDQLFASLVEVVDESRRSMGSRPALVGVGCGGPMAPSGTTVSPLNIPAWRDFPLKARLEDHLGVRVAIDNDAKALALGEGWRGAARGVRDYLAMVVSTGVGGGLVVDGRLLDGRLGNAGHIGHVVVVAGGRRCRCGVDGCLEAEASGTAIEAITGMPAARASSEVVTRTGQLVGQAVASVVTLLDLDLCVVAGSVALGFGTPFFAAANEALERSVGLDFARGATIVPAGLGDEGPLIGAARVAMVQAQPPTVAP